MKKILILMLLSFILVGCVRTNDRVVVLPDFEATPDDGKPSYEHDNEEFEFTWFVNSPSFNWSTNRTDMVSKILKEKTGASIKFITPITDDNQLLGTMISGNKLPDVVSIQSWYSQPSQLASQGYVYPLDDLINKWAPSFKKIIQKDVWNWFKQGDGKTYGIPNFAYSSDYLEENEKLEPNGAILVREDWYEEVTEQGINMSTKDGFKEGCEYIQNKYSKSIQVQLDNFNQDGNNSINWLSQYFAVPFELEDGSYNYKIADERYLEVLDFVNDLTTQGYVKQANYSDNKSKILNNLASGNVFVSMVTPQDYQTAFMSNFNSNIKYVPLVLRNDNGDDPVLQDIRGMGYLFSMITTNAKRPDKIIKVFEYLYSEEGQRLVAFGEEGVTWEWEDETKTSIKWTDFYLDKFNKNDTGQFGLYQMTLLMNLAYINPLKPENGKKEVDRYIENLKKPLKQYSYNYNPTFLKLDVESKDYNDYIRYEARITGAWSEGLPNILRSTTKEKMKAEYNAVMKELKSKKLDFIIQFEGRSYLLAKELLGIEKGWPLY